MPVYFADDDDHTPAPPRCVDCDQPTTLTTRKGRPMCAACQERLPVEDARPTHDGGDVPHEAAQ